VVAGVAMVAAVGDEGGNDSGGGVTDMVCRQWK